MIWFHSDAHFGHKKIIHLCNRPFNDLHEMNTTLTNNWNQCVQPHDIIYDLGDFSFHKKYHIFEDKLQGKIFHIKGNHDKEKWPDFALLNYNDIVIWLQHRPPESVYEISPDVDLVICGHVHEKWKYKLLESPDKDYVVPVINTGVDIWGFKPVSIDQILNLYIQLILPNS